MRDPEQCRAMGAAGRRKVEEPFDAERNPGALAVLFRSGIERRAAVTESTSNLSWGHRL